MSSSLQKKIVCLPDLRCAHPGRSMVSDTISARSRSPPVGPPPNTGAARSPVTKVRQPGKKSTK